MEQFLQVGVISSTHGLRGEVKVFPTTDDAARFQTLKEVILDTGKEKLDLYLHKNQRARARLLAALLDQPEQDYDFLIHKLNLKGSMISMTLKNIRERVCLSPGRMQLNWKRMSIISGI